MNKKKTKHNFVLRHIEFDDINSVFITSKYRLRQIIELRHFKLPLLGINNIHLGLLKLLQAPNGEKPIYITVFLTWVYALYLDLDLIHVDVLI